MERTIKDLDELKQLASREEGCDCCIKLRFGLKSSKHITYNEGGLNPWSVLNLSDDSEQELTDEELTSRSNITEALSKKALILDD